MTYLLKQPDKEIERIEIDNDFEKISEIIGGYVECIRPEGYNKGALIILADEDGKLKKLPFNVKYGNSFLVGNILFAKFDDDGEISGFTEEEIDATLVKINAIIG